MFDGCLITGLIAFITLVVAVTELVLDPSGLGSVAVFIGSLLFAAALGLAVRAVFGDSAD